MGKMIMRGSVAHSTRGLRRRRFVGAALVLATAALIGGALLAFRRVPRAQQSLALPAFSVIETDAWGDRRELLLRCHTDGATELLLASMTYDEFQPAFERAKPNEIPLVVSPNTRVWRFDRVTQSLLPLNPVEWSAANGRIKLCMDDESTVGHLPGLEQLHNPDSLMLHGRRLELAARTCARLYPTRDMTYLGVTSSTGDPPGTYFGPTTYTGTPYFEIFRLVDGARVAGPFQLPEPVPGAGCWEPTMKYFVFRYPNGIVVIPINLPSGVSP